MKMNKNIVFKILGIFALIILIGAIIYFFGIKKEEKIDKIKLLEDIKKITGMDLNLMDQVIKWNARKGETSLDGKGYYYLDLLRAPKLMKIFEDLDKFFKDNKFKKDSRNKDVNSDEKSLLKYKKSNIVCILSRIDNEDNTSSLSVSCADINETICNFNDLNCGRECKIDSDCDKRLDSCQRKNVCVNKNYKFYSECSNPSSLIKDVDLTVQKCQCKDDKCEPYFPYLQSTPTP
jgi:hypothetical protein